MTALSAFVPFVQTDVHDAPRNLILRELRSVLIEFCQYTLYWRHSGQITLVAGTSTYAVPLPSGGQLARIVRMRHHGREVTAKDKDWLDINWPNWGDATNVGSQMTHYVMATRNTVQFIPAPSGTGLVPVDVSLAVQPTRAGTTVDDAIYDDFVDCVAAGASARLLRMPRRAWSNPALATAKEAFYREKMTEAKFLGERHFAHQSKKRVSGVYF